MDLLIELFLLGVTAEPLRAKIDRKSAISLQRGLVDPKFQVERVAPTNHSFSQKTRLNDLLYGIKIWTQLFFRFVTMHAFDRQTDRRTDGIFIAIPRLHFMQRGKNCRRTALLTASLSVLSSYRVACCGLVISYLRK